MHRAGMVEINLPVGVALALAVDHDVVEPLPAALRGVVAVEHQIAGARHPAAEGEEQIAARQRVKFGIGHV